MYGAYFCCVSVQELEAMTRYTSPVNPAVFPHLTIVLLAIGMFFTAWFFVYPLHHNLLKCFLSLRVQEQSQFHTSCLSVYLLNPVCSSYEVTSTKYTRDVYKELLISLVASLFMGFGVLFLLLWVGIYVWRWGDCSTFTHTLTKTSVISWCYF